MTGRHREPTRPGRPRRLLRSRAVRAALCLGCGLGLGGVGTMAYWTDTATVPTGALTSGTLDLRIAGNLPGQGGTSTLAALAMTDMVPGESVSATIPVQSAPGTLPLGYSATGTATGDLAPALLWTVVPGATATAQTGSQAAGNRAGGCTAGTATLTGQVLGGTAVAVIGANTAAGRRTVAAGATENVCVIARLDPNAGNGLQGRSGTATLTFSASQLGAP